MHPWLLVLALSAGPPAQVPAAEPSLAEVSRNAEAARAARTGRPPAKVYTNKDLPPVDRPAATPAGSTVPAAKTPPAPPPAPVPVQLPPPGGDEASWRARMRPLREQLDRARALADGTQRRAAELMRSADWCFRIGVVCAEYAESLRLTDEHRTLVADVARAERNVAALEDEARRAGVPPGWLRE